MQAEEDDPFGDISIKETAADKDATTTEVPRGGPVFGGRREPVPAPPPLPDWEDESKQDYDDALEQGPDYSDLEAVNRDLLHLRLRMSRIRREMRKAARAAVEARIKYQRAYRRALVIQSGGSAESRKARAELLVEDLEAEVLVADQVVGEYNSLWRGVRDEIENAKTVSYNLRALINTY